MAQTVAKIRLFVEADLGFDGAVALSRDQAHYLFTVMRRGVGDALLVFNGRDGEWRAEVAEAGRRAGALRCVAQIRPQVEAPDLWLLFAPLKKMRTDLVAEKASEMGCRRLVPVFTRHTNAERIKAERLRAHAIEAAEQCGLVAVPEVAEPTTLDRILATWPSERRLLFCDESGDGLPVAGRLAEVDPGPWAVLIGPEGGFAPDEAARLRALPFAHAVSLGPRILRADTAAVAALAVFHSVLGDWR
ncbi:MAG: 16S rRNA (uracil(1498)-N(3))-methyltransferase [Pseudomonadota bacterium]